VLRTAANYTAQTAPGVRQAVHWLAQIGGFLGRKSDGNQAPRPCGEACVNLKLSPIMAAVSRERKGPKCGNDKPPGEETAFGLFLVLRMSVRPIQSYKFSKRRRTILPGPPGSAGVPPASRKAENRRRDASAPRKCAPVHGPDARPLLEVEATHVPIPTGNWYNFLRRPRLEHRLQPR